MMMIADGFDGRTKRRKIASILCHPRLAFVGGAL
jgi:hypothetical protein